jgi:hypothetical protein
MSAIQFLRRDIARSRFITTKLVFLSDIFLRKTREMADKKPDLEDITTFLNCLDPSLDSNASLDSNTSLNSNASLNSNLSDLYLFGHLKNQL